jgi:simple sugar transport system substrate-binding protein
MNPRTLSVLALLTVAACNGRAPSGAQPDERAGTRIVFVTHGQSSDPFWSVVANGARAAAADLGVRVEYQSPVRFDMVEMSHLIEAATASHPAGLVVSIPDARALAGPIRAAIAAGIPVVSINSGDEAYRALGVLAHIGQTEYEAGAGAGERLAADGIRHALCINHEIGNIALDRRCTGFGDAMRTAGGVVRVLAVDLADPDDTEQRVTGALAADPSIDGILTLGPNAAEPTLAALERSGRAATIAYATFDLTPRVLEAVRDGRMRFAIDQQQYLQGYLPVILLVTFIETGTMPGGGRVIATGPGFVTRDDAASVIALSARGIR